MQEMVFGNMDELTYQLIVESAPNAIVLVNNEGLITVVNAQAEKLFGYTRTELMGKSIDALVPERFRKAHPGHRNMFFAHPATRPMGAGRDLFALRKDGSEFPVEIGLNPIVASGQHFVMASIIDITERKKAEEQLQAANKELESFSYSVSHDLRAPLRAILGYTQILKEDNEGKLDSEAVRVMGIIVKNAEKMGQLIDDLLDYSRLGRKDLHIGDIEMYELVNELCKGQKNEHPDHNIEFNIKQLLSTKGDSVGVKQVWVNLISNAVKYTALKDKAVIEIGSETHADETVYYIKDNGVGFDMDYAHKLFGVFQRLHSEHEFEGNGVGLAIVHRIILRHGGRVWAESKENEGATFYFTLNKPQNNGSGR